MADIDIDVDDYYYAMDSRERKNMYKKLQEDFDDEVDIVDSLALPKNHNIIDEILREALIEIFKCRGRMSIEQIDNLTDFSNRI